MGIRRSWARAMTAAIATAAVLVPLGPAPRAQAAPPAARVSMKDFAYAPATVHVPVGGSVTWTYDESVTDPSPNCESVFFQLPLPVSCPGHSVTSTAKANGKPVFDSGLHRAKGFPYTVRFSTPGTYAYYCVVHGGPHPNNPVTHMNGVVVVDGPITGTAGAPTGVAASHGAAGGTTLSRSAPALAATGPSGPMGWRGTAAALVAAALGLALAATRRAAGRP